MYYKHSLFPLTILETEEMYCYAINYSTLILSISFILNTIFINKSTLITIRFSRKPLLSRSDEWL